MVPALDGTLYTIREAASLCGVAVSTVNRWINFGCRGRRLKAIRIGMRIRIREDSLNEFLEWDPHEHPKPKKERTPSIDERVKRGLEDCRRLGLKV